ncbi:DUF6662 family protein [Polynucleobacter asymbioticus]|jgi:hypothetical protein|uniref:Lipoprotein n=1 Tax=Polynucleobacter asymbioticus TaxID=576611 RepID=A0AAC9NGY3_9BURK|nr:DUF6662 family protein [Polynucleobacter asymbioticus]APB99443.1 hypothetical protein A4F89_08895 [Polynucleobacter asymbioticus]APC01750.1 hypothetical protein AOC25_09030 [Polynucleobacter asymbioticus]
MKFTVKKLALFTLLLATALHYSLASAGEGNFGWIYTLDLQPKGKVEFEERLQMNNGQAAGSYQTWYSRTELEYGVTDDFQIAGYLNAYKVNAKNNYLNPDVCGDNTPCTAGSGVPQSVTDSGASSYSKTGLDGGSIEAIYRITDPITSPVGVGVYFEPTLGRNANALEYRLLLQSNFIDDRLILAANVIAEQEQLKSNGFLLQESMLDLLVGASYRFMPKLSAGVEARFHNDFYGYMWQSPTQNAIFVGPNIHYAEKDWWVTAAWRAQLSGGTCHNTGAGDCWGNKVWDSHTQNEFIVKVGFPLN